MKYFLTYLLSAFLCVVGLYFIDYFVWGIDEPDYTKNVVIANIVWFVTEMGKIRSDLEQLKKDL